MTRASVGVATLGVGYWPWGPGTLASALVVAAWWWLAPSAPQWLLVTAVLAGAGFAAAGRAERVLGHDDGRIVIDEVAGMALALAAAPRSWPAAVAAFLLFRLFDIAKPPPFDRLQEAPGGWGVMLDDLGSGAAAALVVLLGLAVWGGGG
ncbi:MAG: phosphatidylglycerophosphatase A [Gemmatimonadota bacterium]|nr:phosphatidylglycerophosphatase A [Gemmatimonadota bacterium]